MKYDVIIGAVVNVKVTGIEADSQEQAIEKANEQTEGDFTRLFNRDNPLNGIAYTEYPDNIAHYLVDAEGDSEYERSEWYGPDGKTKLFDEDMKAELIAALKGMLNAYAWGADETVQREGEDALQSDVRRARAAIAKAGGRQL
jgi:hypothetical protein